jgi:NAD(P)-dependent dehydrogenase (short-subunit alcohol dehydrogenase family)
MDFQDKAIIVTGAARGIGRCHAELLAARGAMVVVADSGGDPEGGGQSAAPGDEVVQAIIARGGRAVNVVASVATEEGAARIVAAAIDNFGRLDGLINNAGIIRMSSFADTSAELFRAHYEVHMIGTMLVTKAAWPHLVASGAGRVVNTVSPSITGTNGMIHYASAKGAIWSFTRNLAVIGAQAGVNVNAVSPAAETRMIYVPGMAEALPPGSIEYLQAKMAPEWIAPVVAYLLHGSCRLNGELLGAGGGAVHRMVMVASPGIHSDALTLEEVAARIDEIMDLTHAEVIPHTTPDPVAGN